MPRGSHSKKAERTIALPVIILVALVAVAITLIATSMCSSGDVEHANESEQTATTSENSTNNAQDTQNSTSENDGNAGKQDKETNSKDASEKSDEKRDAATGSEADAADTTPDLSAYTICIDAGHSGQPDSTPSPNSPYASESKNILTEPGGTDGPKSGDEYRICLEVALEIEDALKGTGVKVVQVRTTHDVTISPKERAEIANECDADAFVRLHCDSAGSGPEGFYTLIPGKAGYQGDGGLYKKSQKMGKRMHEFIVKELKAKDRGITVRTDQGGFNWCTQPAVLFEMANLANAADDERMSQKTYKKRMARAIAAACVDYLESLS